jgi:hypothetical protein
MIVLAPILQKVATVAEPWSTFYGDSVAASVTVTFAHLGGLLFGGGLAISADRATLRGARGNEADRAQLLTYLSETHRWVLSALALIFVSGLLLALSDVKTFGPSPIYWTKMSLVLLLLINGAILQRTEQGLRAKILLSPASPDVSRGWARLRLTAVASMILWTSIVLAGVVLVEAS